MCYVILTTLEPKNRFLNFYNSDDLVEVEGEVVFVGEKEFWRVGEIGRSGLYAISGRILATTIRETRLELPEELELKSDICIGNYYLAGIEEDNFLRFKQEIYGKFYAAKDA